MSKKIIIGIASASVVIALSVFKIVKHKTGYCSQELQDIINKGGN